MSINADQLKTCTRGAALAFCGYGEKNLGRTPELLAQAHDLFVFTDEIYEHFVFDGAEHVAPATLPGMERRTITISGLSKVFAITGWPSPL